MVFIKDLQVLTFAVSFNPPSSLNMHGCQCSVYFSGFICIGHLSSLLQGSPILKLPALLLPWTPLYMSARTPCFFTWKELSLYTWTHPSPSLSRLSSVLYIQCWGNGSNGFITLVPIDDPSISLDQNLNSHRSGIQEFWEIYPINMNDCILSHVNGFLVLFIRTLQAA